jgi:hypothetical protein
MPANSPWFWRKAMAASVEILIPLGSIDLSMSNAIICWTEVMNVKEICPFELVGWRGCIDNVTQKRLSVRCMTDFFLPQTPLRKGSRPPLVEQLSHR